MTQQHLTFKIAGRNIGIEFPPYIIAELSANHNGNIETAINIIREAKKAGADAVKLQTYTPDTLTLNSDQDDFKIKTGLWQGRTLYDLYQEAHTPWDWHKTLFEEGKKIGITIFSTPFDNTAVDLLEDLNTPAYKVASFEAIDIPLIKYIAATKKPMIISTGMTNQEEIQEAIDAARSNGCRDLAILRCVSAYPAKAKDYHLRTIPDMQQRFNVPVGLSDHTLDNITAITSIALGACIIEKHFTLDRNGQGPDDSFSLEPEDLKHLCESTKTAWESLGKIHYEKKASEKGNIQFRRSLYFLCDAKKGEIVTEKHIRSVRPGFGLPPKYFEQLIGKKLSRDIKAHTPVREEDFDK